MVPTSSPRRFKALSRGKGPALLKPCSSHLLFFAVAAGKGPAWALPHLLGDSFLPGLPWHGKERTCVLFSPLWLYTFFHVALCLWASAEFLTKEISTCLPVTGDTIAVQKLDLYLWSLYLQVESSVFLLPSANASNVCLCSPLSFPRVDSAEMDCKSATSPV